MSDSATNRTPCPFCGAQVRLPPLPPGSGCNCPKCGKAFTIPGGSAAIDPPKPIAGSPKPVPPPIPAPTKPAAAPPTLPPIPSAAAVPSPYAPPPVEIVTNPLTVRPQPPAAPPPTAKPKPKLIPLNCKLCGTLLYAGLEQQGKTVRCPDCHSAVLVEIQARKPAVDPDAPANAPRPPSAAALETPVGEEDDFQLSPEEPPPLQHADLQAALRAGGHKFNVGADGKIVLEDAPEIETAESKRRRGYDGSPEKENQASAEWDNSEAEVRTFVQGTVKFLQRPEALLRAAAYAIGAAVLSGWLHAGVLMLFGGSGAISQFGGLALFVSGLLAALLYAIPLAACVLRIVQSTANGQDQIDWPDAMFLDWLGESVFLAAALGVAGAPGIVASVVLLGTVIHPWLIPIPIVASEMIFLPIVLLSMIEGGSVASIFSPRVASTLMRGADGLLIFIVQSFLLMCGMFLGVLAQYGFDPIFPPLGAALIVVLGFIYARLLGRLVWYCDVKPAKASAEAEAAPDERPPQGTTNSRTPEQMLRI